MATLASQVVPSGDRDSLRIHAVRELQQTDLVKQYPDSVKQYLGTNGRKNPR